MGAGQSGLQLKEAAKTARPKSTSIRRFFSKKRSDVNPVVSEYRAILDPLTEDLRRKYEAGGVSCNAKFEDFTIRSHLGEGAYGLVMLVTHSSKPDVNMAMKVQQKAIIIKKKQLKHVLNEKRILSSVDLIFIPKLFFSFKDFANIFLVMEFVGGGDFFEFTRTRGKLSETQAKFYASQVIMAFDYLHGADIIYRDLKPENLLVDGKGYLKVTDFGFAKVVPQRTYTLCGTPEYFAPELLTHKPYSKSVDWWGLGILTFEMHFLITPFYDDNEAKMYKKIQTENVSFPARPPVSPDCESIINGLLNKDVSMRLGCMKGGADAIRLHRWFKDFPWLSVYQQTLPVEEIPDLAGLLTKLNPVDLDKIAKSSTDLFVDEFKEF